MPSSFTSMPNCARPATFAGRSRRGRARGGPGSRSGARRRARDAHRAVHLGQAHARAGQPAADRSLDDARLDADPIPRDVELVGDERRERAVDALPHLGLLDEHGDASVARDAQPRAQGNFAVRGALARARGARERRGEAEHERARRALEEGAPGQVQQAVSPALHLSPFPYLWRRESIAPLGGSRAARAGRSRTDTGW
jgi:hypothetical protein